MKNNCDIISLFETFFEKYIKEYPTCIVENKKNATIIKEKLKNIEISEINWTLIKEKSENMGKLDTARSLIIWFHFLCYLIDNNQYEGRDKYEIILCKDDVKLFLGTSSLNKVEFFLKQTTTPSSIIAVKPGGKIKYDVLKCAVIPNADMKIHELIRGYIVYLNDKISYARFNSIRQMLEIIYKEYDGRYSNLSDFNDEAFEYHFWLINSTINHDRYYGKVSPIKLVDKYLGELINFYVYIQSKMDEEDYRKRFTDYNKTVLKYPFLITSLQNKFKIINYNVYDEPPTYDKVILNINNMIQRDSAIIDKCVRIDISIINNSVLKKWFLECFWFDNQHRIMYRWKYYLPILYFLKNIDSRLTDHSEVSISIEDVLKYKNEIMNNDITDSTIARKLSMLKYFFEFLEEKKYTIIDSLVYRFLIHHDSDSTPYKDTYTKSEITDVLSGYKDIYDKCETKNLKLLYKLYYYVVAIQSISEIRVSSILAIKSDSVVKTLSNNGIDEYKLVVFTKVSGNNPEEYNITRYVKTLIDEVSNLTREIRESTSEIEKNYIFIYERRNRGLSAIIRQSALSKHHKKICEVYGIRQLTLGAIRNYYQQQVSEYVTENNYDTLLIEKLSKHGINVHLKHYDNVDIRKFCEIYYAVEIGSVELKGRIDEKSNILKERVVAMGCGHCELDICTLKGKLECMMCDKFVTTLDCIPFFENEIKKIDEHILKESIQHEKEFYTAKKKLHVAYLEKLFELEGAN